MQVEMSLGSSSKCCPLHQFLPPLQHKDFHMLKSVEGRVSFAKQTSQVVGLVGECLMIPVDCLRSFWSSQKGNLCEGALGLDQI